MASANVGSKKISYQFTNGIMSIYSPSLSRRKYFKEIESAKKKGQKNKKIGFKTIRKKTNYYSR